MDELDRRVLQFLGRLCAAPVVLPVKLVMLCLRAVVWVCGLPIRASRAVDSRRHQYLDASRRARDRERDAEAQRRRMEARSQCELLFNLYQADIGSRFNRPMLNDYMGRYMNDAEAPAAVERRGAELRSLIERHREAMGLSNRPTSIDELARWFLEEKRRIEALPLEDDLREEHLAQLQIRYADLSQEILEKARP